VILENNYADPTGSYLCMQAEGDETGIAGYIDDGRGEGGAYDGVPGNVLHVTARARRDFILTGAQLYQPPIATLPGNPAILGAAGYVCGGVTMTGATNTLTVSKPYPTYCISGPPVALSGLKNLQTMPQIASVNMDGNVNLLNGAPITQGANLAWNNGRCDGKAGVPYSPSVVASASR